MSRTKLALDVVQDLRTLADSIEALANAAVDAPVSNEQNNSPEQPKNNTVPTETASPSAADKPLTLIELRAFVAERSSPENRPKIKALLNKFGVNKLTELSEDNYIALKNEVAAL